MNKLYRTYKGCVILGHYKAFKIKVWLFGEYEEIQGTFSTIKECKKEIDKLCLKLRSCTYDSN